MVPIKVSWEDWWARSLKIRVLDTEELRKRSQAGSKYSGWIQKTPENMKFWCKGATRLLRAKGIQVLVNESMKKEHGCKANWNTPLLKGSVPNITMSQERRHVVLLAGRKRKWLVWCFIANISEWDAIIPSDARTPKPPRTTRKWLAVLIQAEPKDWDVPEVVFKESVLPPYQGEETHEEGRNGIVLRLIIVCHCGWKQGGKKGSGQGLKKEKKKTCRSMGNVGQKWNARETLNTAGQDLDDGLSG